MNSILVSEIFGPTIQGEGHLIGKPTVFVRVGGCDFNCSWCDSLYAVDKKYQDTWSKLSCDDIFIKVQQLSNQQPILVTLSGGNPALYDFSSLIKQGKNYGYTFAMETQGSIVKSYFSELDHLTISPKPPSAGVKFNSEKLEQTLQQNANTTLKIVIADEADYQFAKKINNSYPHIPMTIQPCNTNNKPQQTADINQLNQQLEWLIEKAKKDHWHNVSILPQLHVMLWNNQRGV